MVVKEKELDILTSTEKAKKRAGSESMANVTSLADPIPSNDEPVSRAAAVVKKRESPNRYAKRIRSPVKETGALNRPMGTSKPAMNMVVNVTIGPIRKIQVVVVLKTIPLRNSLIMS
jgi:hypothetical protein